MKTRHSTQVLRLAALGAFALVLLRVTPAQQKVLKPQEPKTPKAVPSKLVIPVDLVQIDAVVTDKDGKLIKGLKPQNFDLSEDGKAQKLEALDYYDVEKIETAGKEASEPIVIDLNTANDAEKLRPIVRDHRLIVLYFDLSSLQPEDLLRSTDSARKFLKEQMSAADLVAIVTFGSQMKFNTGFTNNRELLLRTVNSLIPGKDSQLADMAGAATDTVTEDNGAAFTADEGEFNIFNTDSKLYAVQALAELLAGIPGKKSVLEFSSGITQTGEDNRSALRAATDAANKSNVSFYQVDARGLMTETPGGDASTGMARGQSVFSGASVFRQSQARHDSRDTLFTLASDTGGKAFFDLNDFSGIFKQVQDDTTGYYLLSYYSSNTTRDGRYRNVKVKLAGLPPGARIKHRPGYYAPKEFGIFNTEDREKQLDNAMSSEAVLVELPVAVDTGAFRRPDGAYFVPVSAKLATSSLQWAKKSGQHEARFDFLYEVREVKTRRVAGTQRDTMTVQLDNVTFEQLAKKAIVYQGGILLGPGHYRLKFLVRENQTGHIGTFEQDLLLMPPQPNRLELSSVMLSSQLAQAATRRRSQGQQVRTRNLGNDARVRTSPLDVGGQTIVPSVTRVFTSQQTLYVLFQAYAPLKTDPNHLRAGLVFFHGGQRSNDTPLVEPSEVNPVTHVASFRISLPLDKLASGNYTVEAVAVEAGGSQSAFARNYFALRRVATATTATPATPPGTPNPENWPR